MRRKKVSEKGKRKSVFKRIGEWLHSNEAKCTWLILLGGLLIFGLFCLSSAPKRYNLSVGTISHQTITATKDVEDTLATEERRKAAAAAVEPTYHQQEGASEEVMNALDTVLKELRSVQQYGQGLRGEDETEEQFSQHVFTDVEIGYAQTMVQSFSMTAYQARTLMRTESDKFDDMATSVRQAVESALNATIREGQENQAISNIAPSATGDRYTLTTFTSSTDSASQSTITSIMTATDLGLDSVLRANRRSIMTIREIAAAISSAAPP